MSVWEVKQEILIFEMVANETIKFLNYQNINILLDY